MNQPGQMRKGLLAADHYSEPPLLRNAHAAAAGCGEEAELWEGGRRPPALSVMASFWVESEVLPWMSSPSSATRRNDATDPIATNLRLRAAAAFLSAREGAIAGKRC